MKQKYLSSLLWVLRIQWQTSKSSLAWIVLNSIFTGLRPIASAFALAKLISAVSASSLQGASASHVYFWLTVLLSLELISQFMNSLDRIVRLRMQQRMELVTNEQFFIKMYGLSQQQFDDETFNTKLDRARDALFQIWRALDEISWAVSQIIGFLGSVSAVIFASPLIGVVITLTVIPMAVVQVRQNRIREEIYKKTEPYDRVAYRTRWLLIDPSFMPEVRLMNGFKKMLAAWRSNMKKSHDLIYRKDRQMVKYDVATEAIQPLVSFIANIYFFRMLLAGTIGLDRFIFLRGMLEQAVSSASSVGNSVQRLHELAINLGNFSEVFETPPTIPDGKVAVKRPLTIEFKDVSFSYPGSDELVLDGLSFIIHPGSKLALVGENGAGKTTLIKLLLRQYLPTKGNILINGYDIREIRLESYYDSISNLSQDYLIINHLPIRDNLLIGLSDDIKDDKVYEATDLVDATDFIKKLPNQLGTRLDTSFDDGSNLSGGQRQRLVVARALLRNGDILILDEPTSAIDAKAEYSIFNNIYKAHAGRTTLIVSHRFSTVRKADSIIVLDKGKIIEYGSHEELLKHGGLYKEMFDTQAEGYK